MWKVVNCLLFLVLFNSDALTSAQNLNVPPTKTFYVSNSGNDANDGLSPETAWQTISKVNSMQYTGVDTNKALGRANPDKLYKDSNFKQGNHVLFKRGHKWREKLFILSSGTKENPIVFGAYDEGASPIITGAECVSSKCDSGDKWSQVQNGIYSTTIQKSVRGKESIHYGKKYFKDTLAEDAGIVMEDGRYLTFIPFNPSRQADYSRMEAGSFLFNYKTNTLYLRTFEGDTPDNHNIEVAVRDNGIKLKDSEYFIVKDLEVSNAAAGCVHPENIHNVIFDNLHLHSCGGVWQQRFYLGNGITIHHNSTDVIVQNSKIHDVFDTAISPQSFYLENQLIKNITIKNNEMYNAPHSVIEVSNWAKRSLFKNIVIENNKIYNRGMPFSQKYQTNKPKGGSGILVTIEGGTGSKIEDVYIRNNEISDMLLDAISIGFNSGPVYINDNKLRNNKGAGITVFDNNKFTTTNVEVKNNSITDNGDGILFDSQMNKVISAGNILKNNGALNLMEQVKKQLR